MTPVKIGVVGCGAIAQVHHLPNLTDLQDLFEVTCVCDISVGAAQYVAKRFHVPKAVTDYRDLLSADVEAVLLCQSDPKTEVAVAVLEAGKHLFIEKPMCYSLREADRIISACDKAGVVGQVGYMKVFDPAYEYAKKHVDAMKNVRFVQVNHLHPNNALHVRQFDVRYFNDLPAGSREALAAARTAARREAIGDVAPHVERTFYLLAGSMIHDIYGMRVMVGQPTEVVNTEIWLNGRAVSTTLAYANGARAVATWVDLPDLWDFCETLEVYGDDRRVLVTYPTGFARGILSTITVQGIDESGVSYRQEPAVDWETAFSRELRHFAACITEGAPCRASVASARDDIALIIDITKRYMEQH
ncbi:MAG: Gfo/Idh/MocA family oxidoreductase [Chloroflexi bacterium]|nr:Gfo/Idh/MocA family oxidoreductase [Chloroflexota bacterium]